MTDDTDATGIARLREIERQRQHLIDTTGGDTTGRSDPAFNVTATIVTSEPPEHPQPITDHRTFGPFKDRAEAERTVTALASRENVIEAKLWTTTKEGA